MGFDRDPRGEIEYNEEDVPRRIYEDSCISGGPHSLGYNPQEWRTLETLAKYDEDTDVVDDRSRAGEFMIQVDRCTSWVREILSKF